MQIVKGMRNNKNISSSILLTDTVSMLDPQFQIKCIIRTKRNCNIEPYEETAEK